MISSFSKKELERLHLTRSSLEQNLSQVQLSTTSSFQRTLGNSFQRSSFSRIFPQISSSFRRTILPRQTFQQLSLEQPSYKEKTFNNELATTFAKKSLAENLSFQNFFFDNLAFQTTASGELVEKTFYKQQLATSSFTQTGQEACKEQLPATGFPAASANKQLFQSSLVQQSVAKAASQTRTFTSLLQRARELLHRELRQTACRQNFYKNTFAENSLQRRTSAPPASTTTAFKKRPSTKTAFQPAACQKRASEQQLLRQQL